LTKKKKPGKHPPSLPLSPEEQRLLSRFLEDLETLAPAELVGRIPNAPLAERLVESLPPQSPGTPELLAEIGKAFPHKAVQKAMKKKRFQLKQKGISVAEPKPPRGPAFSLTPEEPEAYIGPIDGAGHRPILIVIPHPLSGVDLAMGVISAEKGILEFLHGRYSRKKMKELKEVFFSKVPHMVETSLSHVTTVLENAYNQEKGNPGESAREYLGLRPWLIKNADLLDRPAVSEFIALDSITPGMLTQTELQRLLSHELMLSWAVAPERLAILMEEITRAEKSPIFISEAQRREHILKIKEEGVTKIFDDKERRILRERLQETAYVFFKIGDEPLARLCLTASLCIDQKDSLLKMNPLLSALVDRSLAQIPKPDRSSPLILR
jgi:hypothetical protein